MASKKTQAPRPGYEPVKGHPDPTVARPKTLSVTHYPQRQGPVCGQRPTPTSAAAYDTVNPTCEKCAAWLHAAKANTAARHPEAAQRTAAAEAPTEGKP